MANQRLINCFIKGAFDNKMSNNAKLLYFTLIINADDMGFVGNADKIISDLDNDLKNDDPGMLFKLNFQNAADDLVNRGFCYRFVDKYQNQTLLIRHWFTHNKYQKFLGTNFVSYLAQVDLVNGVYEKKSDTKEKNNTNKTNKLKQINELSNSNHRVDNNDDKEWEKDWDNLMKELEQ